MGTYAITSAGKTTAQFVRRYFPQSAWVTMVAIADAESGFICSITNGPYIGLFQIGPNWYTNPQTMLNCTTNTQTAVRVLRQQGLGAWQSYTTGAYRAFLPLAQQLIALTAPPVIRPAVVVVSPSFGVSGVARVTSGGRILGTLRLQAMHGNIPYRVTMSVSPTYNTIYPTSTTAFGVAAANTIADVNQSLIAPLPSPEIIRAHQQLTPGPVTFPYTIAWSITDPATGQTKTVSQNNSVYLTVQ